MIHSKLFFSAVPRSVEHRGYLEARAGSFQCGALSKRRNTVGVRAGSKQSVREYRNCAGRRPRLPAKCLFYRHTRACNGTLFYILGQTDKNMNLESSKSGIGASRYFYHQDGLKNGNEIYITEGVSDTITLLHWHENVLRILGVNSQPDPKLFKGKRSVIL